MTLCARCLAEMNGPTYPPEVDAERNVFQIDGEARRLRLMALDLLGVLWARRGVRVSRNTAIRLVWGARPPDDALHSLRNLVYELRKVIAGSSYTIETVHGRDDDGGGFRLECHYQRRQSGALAAPDIGVRCGVKAAPRA